MDPHPSAYRLIQGAWVHAEALLPEDPRDIELEPGALIGPRVELGRGTWVGSGAVIYGPTRLGEKNQIFPHAVLGGAPQDVGYAGQPTRLEIGDRNVFREGVTISRGTSKEQRVTRIGSGCLFMACSHVGHDCVLGNGVMLANNALLAGHCHLEDRCILSGGAAVHHFTTIGRLAYLGGLR